MQADSALQEPQASPQNNNEAENSTPAETNNAPVTSDIQPTQSATPGEMQLLQGAGQFTPGEVQPMPTEVQPQPTVAQPTQESLWMPYLAGLGQAWEIPHTQQQIPHTQQQIPPTQQPSAPAWLQQAAAEWSRATGSQPCIQQTVTQWPPLECEPRTPPPNSVGAENCIAGDMQSDYPPWLQQVRSAWDSRGPTGSQATSQLEDHTPPSKPRARTRWENHPNKPAAKPKANKPPGAIPKANKPPGAKPKAGGPGRPYSPLGPIQLSEEDSSAGTARAVHNLPGGTLQFPSNAPGADDVATSNVVHGLPGGALLFPSDGSEGSSNQTGQFSSGPSASDIAKYMTLSETSTNGINQPSSGPAAGEVQMYM